MRNGLKRFLAAALVLSAGLPVWAGGLQCASGHADGWPQQGLQRAKCCSDPGQTECRSQCQQRARSLIALCRASSDPETCRENVVEEYRGCVAMCNGTL